MSRRPTKAYQLFHAHTLEELAGMQVDMAINAKRTLSRFHLLDPRDAKLSSEIARAIQWKLDERAPRG